MSPDAQRIAIAKACGVKLIVLKPISLSEIAARGDSVFVAPVTGVLELPDYLNDLNAMHSAVQSLTNEQKAQFNTNLVAMFCRAAGYEWNDGFADAIHATATQRAESFLKTLNLWTT